MVNSNFPLPSLNRDTAFSDPRENEFIALGWRSEMTMSFHEYTYQDHDYIIRARNTKLAQCTNHAIHSYVWVLLLQAAHTIAICREHICYHVA